MSETLPLTHSYNLARLGNAGDDVPFAADPAERKAIADWAGLLSLESFSVAVQIAKQDASRFGLDFTLTADVTQACVVTLEPVPAHLERRFFRALHFTGPARRKTPDSKSGAESDGPQVGNEVVLDGLEDEGPEQIESLYYDLAAPVLEEFVLALDPYPRCPGVAFEPPQDSIEPPESPFAVLKGLKSGL